MLPEGNMFPSSTMTNCVNDLLVYGANMILIEYIETKMKKFINSLDDESKRKVIEDFERGRFTNSFLSEVACNCHRETLIDPKFNMEFIYFGCCRYFAGKQLKK